MIHNAELQALPLAAIKTPWYPALAHINNKITARIVFPDPTSPCTRRFITLPDAMSFAISFNALFCAVVNSYGRFFTSSFASLQTPILYPSSLRSSPDVIICIAAIKNKKFIKDQPFLCFDQLLF